MKNRELIKKYRTFILSMTLAACTALAVCGCGKQSTENTTAEETAADADTAKDTETDTDTETNTDTNTDTEDNIENNTGTENPKTDRDSDETDESEDPSTETAETPEESGTGEDSAETTDSTETEVSEKEEDLCVFPYPLEDGKISIDSFFTSDVVNTDAEEKKTAGRKGASAEEETAEVISDLATIQITNNSEETLTNCELELILTDGTRVPFTITYLPAGGSALAFATDSAVTSVTDCKQVSVTSAVFSSDNLLAEGSVTATTEENTISVTNVSGYDLADLTVFCHSKLADMFFGGNAFALTIDSLPAGETTTLEVTNAQTLELEVTGIVQK